MWKKEYNNDLEDDGTFIEWYEVSNGETAYEAKTEQEADWLVEMLNGNGKKSQ